MKTAWAPVSAHTELLAEGLFRAAQGRRVCFIGRPRLASPRLKCRSAEGQAAEAQSEGHHTCAALHKATTLTCGGARDICSIGSWHGRRRVVTLARPGA